MYFVISFILLLHWYTTFLNVVLPIASAYSLKHHKVSKKKTVLFDKYFSDIEI